MARLRSISTGKTKTKGNLTAAKAAAKVRQSKGIKPKGATNRRDLSDPDRGLDNIIAEAEGAMAKIRRGQPNPLPSADGPETNGEASGVPGTSVEVIDGETFGLSNSFLSAAAAAGLDQRHIKAALVMATGASDSVAAAEAGIALDTVRAWKKKNIQFRAFLNQITIGMMDEAKGDAIRILMRQLRGEASGHEVSGKDIFDWVKLALTPGREGTRSGSGVPDGDDYRSISPTAIHQHLHVHQGSTAESRTSDDALLVNLGHSVKEFNGDRRRRLADLLREGDGQDS